MSLIASINFLIYLCFYSSRQHFLSYVVDYKSSGSIVIHYNKIVRLITGKLSPFIFLVFVFSDLMVDDQQVFPREFREKYIMSKTLGR